MIRDDSLNESKMDLKFTSSNAVNRGEISYAQDEDDDEKTAEDGEEEEVAEQDEDDEVDEDDDGDEESDDERASNNELIINALSNFVSDNGSFEEDLPAYKSKMKVLLEQLMMKLEEDVDYQKSLEEQVDELEKELVSKDRLIEQLTKHAKETIEECKAQTEDLADEMMLKIKNERTQRKALEKVVVRLQNDNAKLLSEKRLETMMSANPGLLAEDKSSSLLVCETEKSQSALQRTIDELKVKLQQAENDVIMISERRESDLLAMAALAASFQEILDSLAKPKAASSFVAVTLIGSSIAAHDDPDAAATGRELPQGLEDSQTASRELVEELFMQSEEDVALSSSSSGLLLK